MPVNPMQRRARNSFLIGFLVALIIMALVVLFLLYQMKNVKEAKGALEAKMTQVYVASDDLESGQEITMEDFMRETVISSVDPSEIVSEDDFKFIDDDGNYVVNEDNMEIERKMVMKINVPAGTVVTKDMIAETENVTTNDQRIQEYNMILLPSQLADGDYIDIRLSLPKGEDYIVISKKKVISTTETGIWLKLTEDELLTLGNAIVEAYQITGSKLYAIEYTEPGLQEAATPTYPVSAEVLALINSDPNIINEAREALWNRYNANDMAQATQRNTHINSALEGQTTEKIQSAVESGNQEENSKVQQARSEYISQLNGGSSDY